MLLEKKEDEGGGSEPHPLAPAALPPALPPAPDLRLARASGLLGAPLVAAASHLVARGESGMLGRPALPVRYTFAELEAADRKSS